MERVYTKTGDRGTTGTFRGRMGKNEQLAITLGTIDELNSWLGFVRQQHQTLDKEVKKIQTNLLTIGSILSGSGLEISNYEVTRLERLIDKLTAKLPKLANFVYPVGEIHIARAVARRAEREVVSLLAENEFELQSKERKKILKYMNRLSDVLFTLARWINFEYNIDEETWRG